jgi:CPA1 family monovalent cation:H+ antiporter
MIPSQVLVGLAVAIGVIASVGLSRRTRVPEPCFLVLAGVAVSFVPGIEQIRLPPDVIFYGFVPPLLYAAAFLTAPREVRRSWFSILLLALGLTMATLFAVAGVAWFAVAALGGSGAFLLGAALAPTDPITATTVIGTTSAPERLRTILEAESLVNDGVGLAAFGVALTAAEVGGFSVAHGLLKFLEVSAGGLAIGVVVAVVVEAVRRRVHDVEIEIPISLLTPYLAYLPAERAHGSGILATVACGVYLGWRSDGIFRPEVRVQSLTFWSIFTFILSSILFVLLGTQFRPVLDDLDAYAPLTLIRDAALVFAVVVAVRLVWMFTIPHLVALLGHNRDWAEIDPWRDRLLLGWCGMRGALSLAAALSIPLTVAHRDEILFLTFTTILASLVVLGIPLPWLLDRLGFRGSPTSGAERATRRALADAALRRLAELEEDGVVPSGYGAALRQLYENRISRLEQHRSPAGKDGAGYNQLRRELLAAERLELRRRERAGAIGAGAARRIENQLDYEESGLRR